MSEVSSSEAVGGEAADRAVRAERCRALASRHALLPLRLFLGITFVYAALDKLSDAHFLAGAGDQASFVSQTRAAKDGGSPIAFLLGPALDHPTLSALAIAFGEMVPKRIAMQKPTPVGTGELVRALQTRVKASISSGVTSSRV